MRTQIFILIVGLFALNLMGCTRAAKDVAKLNLSIASSVDGNGALAAGTLRLAHVSINVSGAGIVNPIVLTWDGCNDCSVQPVIPSSFPVSVPTGTGRLVQILAVYEDTESNQKLFYYGDVTKDLTASEDTAAIPVTPVATGTITGGHVAGRYFTTATGGPTGLIDIRFNPGAGKPDLIVDNAVIVNGWFSMFMLSGASFKYVIRGTDITMWDQQMSLDSAPMDPSENSGAYFNQRVRAFLPVHIAQRSDNGVTSYKKQDAETYVWGYWGPGATGKRVCTSGVDGSPTPQRLKQYTTGTPESAPALSVSHYVNWNLSVPTKAQLTDVASPYTYIVFQGGMSMSSSCDSFADTFANQFTNFQKVTLTQIDGNGGDAVAGFSGIFRNTSTNSFAAVSSADPKVITGQILPGVDEVFDGLRLFKRPGSDDYRMNVARCNELAPLGFIPASTTDAALTSAGTFSLTSNITSTEGTSGVSAVLCPVKAGVMAPLGVFMSKWNFSMGGGGGSSSPATKLALVSPQKSTTSGAMVNNVCTPMMIETRTASDTIGYPSGMITINLSSTDGNTTFYNYSSCSGAVSSIQTSSPYAMIYVKRTGSGTASATFNITAAGLSGTSSAFNFADMPGTVIPKIMINFPSTISAYECYPISFESWHSNLYLINFYDAYAQYFTLNLALGSGINYYSGGDCVSGSYTTASLGSSPASSMYFKYTGNASNLNLQPTSISPASPILTSDIVGGNNITVIQPGVASTMDLMIPLTFAANQCQAVTIRSTDSNGRTAPTTSALSLDLTSTASGGTFYQDSSCTTPITLVNYATATTMQMVYFKASAAGAGTVTASSSSPTISVTRNVTVGPEVYSQMFIALPGQSYSPGSGVVGTPTRIPQGMPSYAQIYLAKADGQVDTNANGMLLTSGNLSGGTMQSPTAVSFTNGVGTLSFMPDSSYNTMYLNLYSNTVMSNSPALYPYLPATMMNIYMSNQAALAPSGCQIFAVVPESMDGPSTFFMPASFNISADNGGGVYTDAACTTLANASYTFYDYDRIKAFYFKQPTASTNSSITVTSLTGGITSVPITVGTNATTIGASYKYLLTGSTVSMKSAVCQPYLVSVADIQGRSVTIGADQTISSYTNYGVLYGSCDAGGAAPTSIPSSMNYTTFYLKNLTPGYVHQVDVSGSPLTMGSSTGFMPNP